MSQQTIQIKSPQTFKFWSGKSYALFSIIGRVVKIGVLAVVYHLASPAQGSAQIRESDTIQTVKQYELEEISVEALRSPAVYSEAVRAVTVVRKETLQAGAASSLPEVLRHLPGIDIRQRGPEGIQADISLRGGSFDQTLIMVNGINVSDPQTGHHNFNLPIPHSIIERIEILEGSGSRLYGPNAFSGVINIITTPGTENQYKASLVAGSHGFGDANLSATLRTGKFATQVAMQAKKSDGYIKNTDFLTGNLFLQTRGSVAGGTLDLQSSMLTKAFGANAFYTPLYPEQFEETLTHLSSVRWTGNILVPFTIAAYLRTNSDRFELFRYDAPAWYKGHNYHRTAASGAYANAHITHAAGKTSAGIEIRNEMILSNVLGVPIENPIKVSGEEAFYTRKIARMGLSLFADHTIVAGNFQANAGIMGYLFGSEPNKWKFFPGIDIAYNFSPSFSLYSSIGKSLRLPTFTDLYYNGPTNIGNPDLKPEEVLHVDAGIKLKSRIASGIISLYQQKGTDLIDWVRRPEEVKWSTTNHGIMIATGISAQIELFPSLTAGSKSFVRQVTAGFNAQSLKKEEADFISYYIADHLRHKFNLGINHRIARAISAQWNLTYTNRSGSYTAYSGTQPVETRYQPFCLLDGKLAWDLGKIELFLSATNLGNAIYYDFGNIPQPGRWMKFGIQLR